MVLEVARCARSLTRFPLCTTGSIRVVVAGTDLVLTVGAKFYMASRKKSEEKYTFGPWTFVAKKTHISGCEEIEQMTRSLGLPALPEMLFGGNSLSVMHCAGHGLEFRAQPALAKVSHQQPGLTVACSETWQRGCQAADVVQPYDWTYTTDYRGCLTGSRCMQVQPTTERIDQAKLMNREPILFFEDIVLFEDELHDHGISVLSVKVRVMQSGFFLLLRFFLRVDGVVIRVNETRIYHQVDTSYLIREFVTKERYIKDIPLSLSELSDPAAVFPHLHVVKEESEKLLLPSDVNSEGLV
uniref:TIP41-like protein isoform X2 n=1 Tax=Myxine glutinosa TaxID=7769 RepID=UPI0035902BD1